MKANPDNKEFLEAVKKLKEGDILKVDDGELVLEHKFSKPTHFTFHQRIFPAGVILKKKDSNIRIFIEAEKLGLPVSEEKGYDDRQIVDGKILPADRGLDRTKVIEK